MITKYHHNAVPLKAEREEQIISQLKVFEQLRCNEELNVKCFKVMQLCYMSIIRLC